MGSTARVDNVIVVRGGGAAAVMVLDSHGDFTHGFNGLPHFVDGTQRVERPEPHAKLARKVSGGVVELVLSRGYKRDGRVHQRKLGFGKG